MAERVGFEPTVPLTGHNGFRDRPDRPLWHLSVLRSCSVIRRRGDYLNQRPAAIAARSRGEKSPGKAHGQPKRETAEQFGRSKNPPFDYAAPGDRWLRRRLSRRRV